MAAVMPKTMMAIRKICRIALSPARISPAAMQDNARTAKKENEVYERCGAGTVIFVS